MLENDLLVRFNLVYARTNLSIWVSEVKKQAHVDTDEKDQVELLMSSGPKVDYTVIKIHQNNLFSPTFPRNVCCFKLLTITINMVACNEYRT